MVQGGGGVSTNAHSYVCECPGRHCRERLRLTPARYAELSRYGAVVSPYCTADRRVVHREPGVRVVASTLVGDSP